MERCNFKLQDQKFPIQTSIKLRMLAHILLIMHLKYSLDLSRELFGDLMKFSILYSPKGLNAKSVNYVFNIIDFEKKMTCFLSINLILKRPGKITLID